ncbi:MAG TPA: carboxypeptidase-like regulatory domain-containing protein, partial [Sphingobacteriaceae bacterium]
MRNIFFTSILVLCCMLGYAQRSIKGTVKDETGLPLPGVSIRQVDAAAAGATNGNGEFTLTLDNTKPAVLVFSMIGFESKEVDVRNQSTVAV